MTKAEKMNRLAESLTEMIREFGRRSDITILYVRPDRETIGNYTEFQQKYHGIIPGQEYFMVYEEEDGKRLLLYVVNVTADSYLTAANELMNLASRKF